jgi:hypothetical protein
MRQPVQAENRSLRQQLSAYAWVDRNPGLRPSERIVARVAIPAVGWRKSSGADTPYQVNFQRLAEATGVSAKTVGAAIQKLSSGADRLFERQLITTHTGGGQIRSTVQLTPCCDGNTIDMLKAAASFAPDRPTWGGKREIRCPEHPTAPVLKRTSRICVECGNVLEPTDFHRVRRYVTDESPPLISVLRTTRSGSVTTRHCRRPAQTSSTLSGRSKTRPHKPVIAVLQFNPRTPLGGRGQLIDLGRQKPSRAAETK